jgi:hypothetical protein
MIRYHYSTRPTYKFWSEPFKGIENYKLNSFDGSALIGNVFASAVTLNYVMEEIDSKAAELLYTCNFEGSSDKMDKTDGQINNQYIEIKYREDYDLNFFFKSEKNYPLIEDKKLNSMIEKSNGNKCLYIYFISQEEFERDEDGNVYDEGVKHYMIVWDVNEQSNFKKKNINKFLPKTTKGDSTKIWKKCHLLDPFKAKTYDITNSITTNTPIILENLNLTK